MENRVLRNGEYASHDHADGDGVGNLVKSDGKPQSVAASQLRWGCCLLLNCFVFLSNPML